MFGCKENPTNDRLHAVNFGLAWGLSCGLYFLFIGLVAWMTGWGGGLMQILGGWYPGAGPTLGGSLLAAFWGFIDAFIGGWLIAVFYNWLQSGKR